MAGQEDRHRLVAKLPVGHPAAVLVAGAQEHGHEVAAVRAPVTALADDLVDELVEPAHGTAVGEVRRQGHPVGDPVRPPETHRDLADHDVEGGADLLHLAGHLRPEEGLGHDPHREAHHLVVDVAHLLRPPLREHLLRLRHHHRAVGGDAVPVEGGLGEAPLPEPEVALAGQEAVAENGVHVAPEEAVLHELRAARDEHALDDVWMVDQAGRLAAEAHGHDVAVAPRAVFEEAEEIAGELGEVPDQQVPRGSGRAESGVHASHEA